MVKTENVESEDEISGVGAHISIEGSTERSVAIQGTSDWQRIELIFNSKDDYTNSLVAKRMSVMKKFNEIVYGDKIL